MGGTADSAQKLREVLAKLDAIEETRTALRAEREALVVALLDEGWTTAQVASMLGVTQPKVVQIHNKVRPDRKRRR